MFVGVNPITKSEVVIVNDRQEFVEFYNKNKHEVWCGWNIRGYDTYIIKALVLGFNPKAVNDWIIVKGKKGYEYSSLFNKVTLNIYDAMPGIPVSLKVMEGFLGKNIHETSVPFDIDRPLTPSEIEETIDYCKDDVYNLIEVFLKRKSEFDSHLSLVKEFNLPLSALGKTQAQLAALILGAKRKKLTDEWNIRLPDTLQLGKYQAVGDWFLNKNNHNYDAKLEVEIAGMTNVIAFGGLHAGRNKFSYVCKDDEVILDADIGQMYPNIMLHYNLQSRGVSDKNKLKDILETSMRLKREGKKKEREPYKRICNIVYGACGDKFNPMYDALHRNLVCVFGQVLMIDLIDKIEDLIFSLNHNTDGIFFVIKKKDIPELKRRVSEWEQRTHLTMEYEEYSKMIMKDVNNYLAVRTDGSIHAKGAYVKDLNDLDFDLAILNDCVRNFLIFGTPTDVTVNACSELKRFQKIVKLSNKYKWVEHEYGKGTTKFDNKAYRCFASLDNRDGRLLKCDGVRNPAKFAGTADHCFVINEDINDMAIPDKLDKQWYISEANKRLKHFGVL
jgi:hypothetical protein